MKTKESSIESTFDALFTQYWSRIYRLLFSLVGDHGEAEDLALEVFWRYYQHPPDEQDAQKLGGWLYRVALRLGYNSLRAQRRRRGYEQRAGQQEILRNPALHVEEQVETAEQRQQVRRVLAQMRPRSAQILMLRYNGGSYAEVAATLNISVGSVGTLLSRAEREFQRRFERDRGRE